MPSAMKPIAAGGASLVGIAVTGCADSEGRSRFRDVLGMIEWLTGDECHDLDDVGLVAGLGRRLSAAGLPLDGLSLHLRTLHPEILGRTLVWAPGEPVKVYDREYGFERSAAFAGSPLRRVMESGEWLVARADDGVAGEWLPLHVLRQRGLVELVLAPLRSTDGPVSAVAFGTQRPAGFSPAERAMLERIVPALRGVCELRMLRQSEANLLDTYIGPQTGRRVLAGHIRRGDVETIEAALLFCDLRGFTELSNRLPAGRVLQLLDLYYDQVVPAVATAGGEILKFMGDGLLAIFRRDDAPQMNCAAAFDAAHAALARLAQLTEPDAELHAGIALHHGYVSYGNIGSGRRLDFTVIGAAVNLVSRIQALCDSEGRPQLLMSAACARLLRRPDIAAVGRHLLKGFDEPVELFTWVAPAMARWRSRLQRRRRGDSQAQRTARGEVDGRRLLEPSYGSSE
jgi:adenylate cyclase